MEQYYYIDKNGQQQGPVPANKFSKYGVTRNTKVWKQGMTDWQTAGSILELRKHISHPLFRTPVLLIYAAVATILFSIIFLFLCPFIAFLLSTCISYVAIVICVIIGVIYLLVLIIKKFREMWIKIFLLFLPVLLASLFAIIRYNDTLQYHRYNKGWCYIYSKDDKIGVLNMFGLEIVPCEYDYITPLGVWQNDGYYYFANYGYISAPSGYPNRLPLSTKGDVDCFQVGKKWYRSSSLNNNKKPAMMVKYGLISSSGEELCPCKYQIELPDGDFTTYSGLDCRNGVPKEVVIFRYDLLGGQLRQSYAADKCMYGKYEFDIEDVDAIGW